MNTQLIARAALEAPTGMATLIPEEIISVAIKEYGKSEQEYFDYLEKELRFKYMQMQQFLDTSRQPINTYNFKKL